MKVFFDTSALAKKYIEEPGIASFDRIFSQTTSMVVAPIYVIEMNSILHRRWREGTLTEKQVHWLKSEIFHDALAFEQVVFSDSLITKAIALMDKYPLVTLDSIQLASASLTEIDMFVTADKKLSEYAKRELGKVEYI